MAKKTKEVAPEFDAVLLKEVVDGTLKDGFLYANPGSLAPLAAAETMMAECMGAQGERRDKHRL